MLLLTDVSCTLSTTLTFGASTRWCWSRAAPWSTTPRWRSVPRSKKAKERPKRGCRKKWSKKTSVRLFMEDWGPNCGTCPNTRNQAWTLRWVMSSLIHGGSLKFFMMGAFLAAARIVVGTKFKIKLQQFWGMVGIQIQDYSLASYVGTVTIKLQWLLLLNRY